MPMWLMRPDYGPCSAGLAESGIMERLVVSDADILVILDSDMIVARNFIHAALPLFAQTSGFLSLFNTPTHPVETGRAHV